MIENPSFENALYANSTMSKGVSSPKHSFILGCRSIICGQSHCEGWCSYQPKSDCGKISINWVWLRQSVMGGFRISLEPERTKTRQSNHCLYIKSSSFVLSVALR